MPSRLHSPRWTGRRTNLVMPCQLSVAGSAASSRAAPGPQVAACASTLPAAASELVLARCPALRSGILPRPGLPGSWSHAAPPQGPRRRQFAGTIPEAYLAACNLPALPGLCPAGVQALQWRAPNLHRAGRVAPWASTAGCPCLSFGA